MKAINITLLLGVLIIVFSALATIQGITSNDGPGQYEHMSVRNNSVKIYGKGLYKDMSAEVAPQGIAQDYGTLLIAIPLLMISLYFSKKGSIRWKIILTGTLAYFLVTYLFYSIMAMYNAMYIVYVLLTGCSFYAFIITIISLASFELTTDNFTKASYRVPGGFLIVNSILIALLWLGIILPPLIDGSIIPVQVEHYTTLIVQAIDLAILLPASFIAGLLLIRKAKYGLLLAPVYLVFLSLLMTALTAKIFAMKLLDYNVIPAIYIIPVLTIFSIWCAYLVLNSIPITAVRNGD